MNVGEDWRENTLRVSVTLWRQESLNVQRGLEPLCPTYCVCSGGSRGAGGWLLGQQCVHRHGLGSWRWGGLRAEAIVPSCWATLSLLTRPHFV